MVRIYVCMYMAKGVGNKVVFFLRLHFIYEPPASLPSFLPALLCTPSFFPSYLPPSSKLAS